MLDSLFDRFRAPLDLVGRIGLAYIFVLGGVGKIGGYAATAGYMESMGVPGALLPLVILVELGGGLAVLVGLFTRPVAVLLAGFCIVSALLFHGGADRMQQIMLMKNLAMAGGFLVLAAHGAGVFSLDARRRRK